ncbi:MAG: hypothetical protein GY930_11160 [bacterium]|nr:hypothetical protein [bacterium]
MPSQPARYEAAALERHHHFHCEVCDRVFDIPGCLPKVHSPAPLGFVARTHELTLKGSCPGCP